MAIKYEPDMDQITSVVLRLKEFPRHLEKACNSALQRAKESSVSLLKKEIPLIYDISVGTIGEKSKVTGKVQDGSIVLKITGKALTSSAFPHTPTELPRSKPNYIPTISIKKEMVAIPKKRLDSGELKSIFIAPTSDKEDAPLIFFYRTGKPPKGKPKKSKYKRKEGKLPLLTLSIPQMINNPDIHNKVMEKFETTFIKRIDHETNRQLNNIAIQGIRNASK